MAIVSGDPGDNVLRGTDQDDVISGFGGDDTLYGVGGLDILDGGSGDDTLVGGAGGDSLTGGSGADTFVIQALDDSMRMSGATDVINDFEHGIDRIDFRPLLLVVPYLRPVIYLSHNDAGQTGVFYAHDSELPFYVGALLANGFVGPGDISYPSAVDYTISGAPTGDDVLVGGAGNDFIYGSGGDDQLAGGAGNDELDGGAGADTLTGGAGADVFGEIGGQTGPTTGYDFIGDFQTQVDKLMLIDPGAYVDLVPLGNDLTAVFFDVRDGVAQGALVVHGPIGSGDLLFNTIAPTIVTDGGAGDDVLVGSFAAEVLRGGAGDDYLVGGGGSDHLAGGAGADVFAYDSVADSPTGLGPDAPPSAYDSIVDFEHGQDKIDLRRVSGAAVAIIHDGAGDSLVYFAAETGVARGGIFVVGDVEAGDVIAAPGAVITTYEGFASAAAASEAHQQSEPHSGRLGHMDLY